MDIIFNPTLIALKKNISTAEQAIEFAGTLLVRQNICRPEYINAMVEVYRDFGPAIVIDYGLAMPHARPGKRRIANGFFLSHHPTADRIWPRGV
nr:PTS system transporter subunit IIA [Raoultella sp. NCTC 9187]